MKWNLSALAAGFGLLLSVPVFAHHSFEAEYDSNKPINITGSVTKVEWMNPHARFYVDLKVGDMVTVEGYLAKDGAKLANARRVTLPDGRKVFAGSTAAEGGPQQ